MTTKTKPKIKKGGRGEDSPHATAPQGAASATSLSGGRPRNSPISNLSIWCERKISEVADVTDFVANGSFESLRINVVYRDNPDYAVLIRLVDYKSGWSGGYVYVDRDSYDFLRKSSLEEGDIIIANVGANAGTIFRAPKMERPMTLGPNAIVCRPKNNNEISRDFLYYFLISNGGQNKIRSIISGSAQPKFNKTDFRGLSVSFPDIRQQRSISSLLCYIDEKIEELRPFVWES